MKKVKDFMNKPITWGAYFKMCGVLLGAYAATMAGLHAKYKYDERKGLEQREELLKSVTRFNNVFEENESE